MVYDQGQTDFRSQIVKIKALDPEGVYLIGVPIEAGLILKQSTELGFHGQFLTNNMESPDLLKNAGNAAEGIYFAIPEVKLDESQERVRQFVNGYLARYGKKPDMFAADAYDAVFITKWAFERTGNDDSKIKDVLYTLKDFPGVAGCSATHLSRQIWGKMSLEISHCFLKNLLGVKGLELLRTPVSQTAVHV